MGTKRQKQVHNRLDAFLFIFLQLVLEFWTTLLDRQKATGEI